MIRRPPRSTRTDTLFPTRRSSDLLQPEVFGIATTITIRIPYRGFDVGADHRIKPLRGCRATGSTKQPVGVVVGHPTDLLLAHRIGLEAEQPAHRTFEDVAVHHRVGERCAGDRKSTRLNSSP